MDSFASKETKSNQQKAIEVMDELEVMRFDN
jgi:hypothetical protein